MTPRADNGNSGSIAARLAERGVIIPRPDLVVIGEDVPPEQIAPGAVLHPFTQLRGARTRIDAGAVIGEAGPVVIEDSWIAEGARIGTMGPVHVLRSVCGPGTVLGSGSAEDAVFLGKEVDDPAISCGLGFRVRKGSLYEEDASTAQHSDTKMTILFPWVTLGSNVNWCDLLMAGGVGPAFDQFSEVGSGAVHFNFTPRGDKATGSLFGNVPEGVYLKSPRLFIGGNGSIVGPVRMAFRCITAAGRRYHGTFGPGFHGGDEQPSPLRTEFSQDIYGSIKRVYDSQVRFIGELAALDAWYGQARPRIARGGAAREALYEAARETVRVNLAERIHQLGALAARMQRSAGLIERSDRADLRIHQHRTFADSWPKIEKSLLGYESAQREIPKALADGLDRAAAEAGLHYTRIVRALDERAVAEGSAWLRGIAERVATAELLAQVPALPGQ